VRVQRTRPRALRPGERLATARSQRLAPHDSRSILCAPAARTANAIRDYDNAEAHVSVSLSLNVNGKTVREEVDPRTLLVDFLRRNLSLTGTHVGCDTAQCGACTVLVDGRAVKACNVLAAQVQGASVTTIEGLAAADGQLHPMQAAFKDCHGLQCGFCTTGMVMSALDLVARHPNADEQKIREELEGNLCRCTGYHNIVKAVRQGATAMAK
jgi:carbon-monoxide dehydrogenase small subunit